jgi:hypothetical protein
MRKRKRSITFAAIGAACAVACLCAAALAVVVDDARVRAKRIPVADVNVDRVVADTRPDPSEPVDRFETVWFIPHEFWAISLAKDKTVPPAMVEEVVRTMQPYFLIAIVQGDYTVRGATRFTPEAAVRKNTIVRYARPGGGRPKQVAPIDEEDLDDRVVAMLQQLRPNVVNTLGGAAAGGENVRLLVFPAEEEPDDHLEAGAPAPPTARVANVYLPGILLVETRDARGRNPAKYRIYLPLDALYQPRICACCKIPMNVLWNFCPLGGQRLPELEFEE